MTKQAIATPEESTKLFASFTAEFSDDTAKWLVLGKSGQARIAEREVIAVQLASGKKKYHADRDEQKTMRKSWRKMTTEKKEGFRTTAAQIFRDCRKEYCDTVNPLLKAASADKRFHVERAQFQMTKTGIVHVGSRLTYRPPVETVESK